MTGPRRAQPLVVKFNCTEGNRTETLAYENEMYVENKSIKVEYHIHALYAIFRPLSVFAQTCFFNVLQV